MTTATAGAALGALTPRQRFGANAEESLLRGTPKNETPSFYRPELDLIRFVGFTMVCLGHLFLGNTVEHLALHVPHWAARFIMACAHGAGYSVDSFFLLSAYLITELLLRERETTGTSNTRAFYVRRILRVWPLYFLYIAFAASSFLDPNHEFTSKYIVAFVLMVGNWGLIAWGWPDSSANHLWTVSVEEQFYLLWPLAVGRLNRQQITRLAIGMIVVANLYRGYAVATHQTAGILWTNTVAHIDSIAAGVLVSTQLQGRIPKFRLSTRIALVAAASACFIWRGYLVRIGFDEPLGYLGTIFGFPLMVASCTAILLAFLGANLRSPILEYLGKISYGLYVYHFGCIALVLRYLPRFCNKFQLPVAIVMVFASTILVSIVSYELFEKRFLRLKRRFTYVESRSA